LVFTINPNVSPFLDSTTGRFPEERSNQQASPVPAINSCFSRFSSLIRKYQTQKADSIPGDSA
jgi:hypothetical protein